MTKVVFGRIQLHKFVCRKICILFECSYMNTLTQKWHFIVNCQVIRIFQQEKSLFLKNGRMGLIYIFSYMFASLFLFPSVSRACMCMYHIYTYVYVCLHTWVCILYTSVCSTYITSIHIYMCVCIYLATVVFLSLSLLHFTSECIMKIANGAPRREDGNFQKPTRKLNT